MWDQDSEKKERSLIFSSNTFISQVQLTIHRYLVPYSIYRHPLIASARFHNYWPAGRQPFDTWQTSTSRLGQSLQRHTSLSCLACYSTSSSHTYIYRVLPNPSLRWPKTRQELEQRIKWILKNRLDKTRFLEICLAHWQRLNIRPNMTCGNPPMVYSRARMWQNGSHSCRGEKTTKDL